MNSNPSSSPSASAVSSPGTAVDSVARRAYEIWEQEGRPEGCELQHWLRAEQEINRSANQGQIGSGFSPTAITTNGASDVHPLQGARAAGATNREGRRSANPFSGQKSAGRRNGAAPAPRFTVDSR